MKSLTVLISGAPAGDNLRDLEIEPATSAGDILRALNLQGYLLSREGSNQAFAAEEGVYEQVEDGTKLRAAPISEVGTLPALIQKLLSPLWMPQLFSNRVVLKQRRRVPPLPKPPHRAKAVVAPPHPPNLRVERDRRELWEIRGWRRVGSKLIGAYRTPKGSCVGQITVPRRGRPEFYITNPPPALLNGPHSSCFRRRGPNTFFVHMGVHGSEVDSGIVAIEKLLVKAL